MIARTNGHITIAVVTSIAIILMAVFATLPKYHVAPVLLIPLVWAVFAFRHWLHLRPANYALLASALLMHMAGAFGMYQRSPLPFSFDILVHFWFAFVGTFALLGALDGHFRIRRVHLFVMTFLFMMGLAAMHEIMEYCSYLFFGKDYGMLNPDANVSFDTLRDMTNNLLGTLLALLIIALRPRPADKTA